MAKFTQTYPTDLKDTAREQIEEFFPEHKRGRSRKWAAWQILNAILHVTRTGCQWRILPVNYPPWRTVNGYFWRWNRGGVWEQTNRILVKRVRQKSQTPGRTQRGDFSFPLSPSPLTRSPNRDPRSGDDIRIRLGAPL